MTAATARTSAEGAADAVRSASLTLLINPRSFSVARGGWASPAALLGRRYGAEVLQACSGAEIAAVTNQLLAQRRDALFLLAGDGTVQALIDRLAALPAGARRPRLFVLGGGRSNVIALALGGSGNVLQKLEQALRLWREGGTFKVESLPALRIEQTPTAPRHGFLFAAGLLDHIIRACHRAQARCNKASDTATALQVLRIVLAGLCGREPTVDAIQLDAAGPEPVSGPARFLIATTLDPDRARFHPFAARGSGPLHFTALAAPGPRLWLRLPWVALGRFAAGMDAGHGYLSGRCERLHLHGLSSYTLDGEEFSADPARPTLLGEGPRIAFLTL